MILNALKVFFPHLKHSPCLLSWLRNPAQCSPTISLSFHQNSVNVIPSTKTPMNAVVLSFSAGRLRGSSGVPRTSGPVVSGWGDQLGSRLWSTWLPWSLHAGHGYQRMDIYIPPFLSISTTFFLTNYMQTYLSTEKNAWNSNWLYQQVHTVLSKYLFLILPMHSGVQSSSPWCAIAIEAIKPWGPHWICRLLT